MTILRASCTALAALGMLSSAACMTNSKGDMIREYLDCQAERDPYFEESVMIISPLPWTCRTPRTSRSTSATPLPWTIRRRPGTRCAGVIVAAALAAQGGSASGRTCSGPPRAGADAQAKDGYQGTECGPAPDGPGCARCARGPSPVNSSKTAWVMKSPSRIASLPNCETSPSRINSPCGSSSPADRRPHHRRLRHGSSDDLVVALLACFRFS